MDELEKFKNYKFIEPNLATDADLELRVRQLCPYNPQLKFVPEYKFNMIHIPSGNVMGEICIRVGLTQKMKEYGGHIGYHVLEPFRGQHYAARSIKLLIPLLKRLGINPVVITCSPENLASAKTIEASGAKLVITKEVEIEPGTYRMTSIYHLHP